MTPAPDRAVAPPLVLASASPRRSAILAARGYEFRVVPADVDETPPLGLAFPAIAESIAARKLRAVAPAIAEGVVVAADTIVVVGRELLAKPSDEADARRMLATLSGTTHEVITGIALQHRPSGHERVASAVTRVTMRAITAEEIDAYVATGEPFGKAGGYAIQERADRFVLRLDGPYDNVVGLPGDLLAAALAALLRTVEEAAADRDGRGSA